MSDDINVNYIADQLAKKVDLPDNKGQDGIDYVVEWQNPTADNNYTWYRKYKSGWVEQGGYFTDNTSNNSTINFLVNMSNTNYTATALMEGPGDTSMTYFQLTVYSRSLSSMTITHSAGSYRVARSFSWEVKGQGA